jgi:hypothetical protein
MDENISKLILPQFEKIKDNDEEILWTSHPKFIPYIFTKFGLNILFLVIKIFGFIVALCFTGFGFVIAFIILISIILSALNSLKEFFLSLRTYYAYSDKRVMITRGIFFKETSVIDYDKITEIEVQVNFAERIFNTGTIIFYTDNKENYWYSISDPYHVFKMVKKTTVDIKTDYNYPNAIRPDTNPGYRTKYKPEN